MSRVLVPVGLDMGQVYAAQGPPDRPPMRYEVHLGGESIDLDATQYTVWSAVFADEDAQVNFKVDRQWVVAYLRDFGERPVGRISDASATVDELVGLGLLLEYDPAAGDDLAELFGAHRLLPRALGLGSTVHLREMFGIGYGRSRFCEMPPEVYSVWAYGPASPTLWDACDIFSKGVDWELPPGEEPANLTAAEVATSVAENLPLLLSTRAAFLDSLNYELPRAQDPVPFPTDGRRRTVRGRAPVILPVGLPLGWDYAEGGPGEEPHHAYQLQHGVDYVDLTEEQSQAWHGAAKGTMQQHARFEMTKARLVDHLRNEHGIADAGALVADMLQRGYLVEFDPVEGPLEELFRAIQLFPLGDAYGNASDQPGLYRLGVEDTVLLSIEPEPYMIRSYALTCPSLWDACVALAEGADEDLQPGEVPVGLTPAEVARSVAVVLPMMVASGCAFIDPLNYVL